jgi:hypothetical protein
MLVEPPDESVAFEPPDGSGAVDSELCRLPEREIREREVRSAGDRAR